MKPSRLIVSSLLLVAMAWSGWEISSRLGTLQDTTHRDKKDARPAPVVTAPIETGPIALERAFSGTLEAYAEFIAAPKVSGIVERLSVDLGDSVARGQVVARLDNAEYMQAVTQAEAEVKVAKANLAEAKSLLAIAERELKRIDQLSARGVSSAAQRDVAQADQLAKQAHVQVSAAQLARAESELETARIRLGYTEVIADWHVDDRNRVVAERYVDEGETVSANTQLLKIVSLNPITAVIHVTEKQYAGLQAGQQVALTTDAYPEREFSGVIEHIAPVFRATTRQARIEVQVSNGDLRLKPGMFVRAKVVLTNMNEVTVIPFQALTRRDGADGVFVLSPDGSSVSWHPVQPGIRQDERLQVTGEGLQGRVVVLGQQLLMDGSAVLATDQQRLP
ncbi:MAG: efflux RND transporter periplasmic adaptor subunit [Gammaproteobacteria bacterium]|nr:efflux RND transporter periplasmic adaptor subunit [Gammaproteobacteria bacterium]MCP5417380.1 efflux RND transporter periplasmic adaptor subunit [Chromatiaceae bacterium]